MAGINLSQSLQEKELQARGSFLDKGFYINLGILVFVLVVFGGTEWYLHILDNNIADLDAQALAKTTQLKGSQADRVSDLSERFTGIGVNIASEPDPGKLFGRLEGAILPSVRLMNYEENWEDGNVKLEGVTDNLKNLAQQMLSLKRVDGFQKVSVDKVFFNTANRVEFSLIVSTSRTTP